VQPSTQRNIEGERERDRKRETHIYSKRKSRTFSFSPPWAHRRSSHVMKCLNVTVYRTVVRLGTPALHFLWDHVVAGRPILPGAAMFETFAAAACTLAEGSGLEVCLTGLAIPAPVPLSTSAAPVVECALNYVTGEMQLANLALTGPGAIEGLNP
jgi:hypothetical protein